MADPKLPKFSDEVEEARWWFEHRAEIGKNIVAASRQGRLGQGSMARAVRKTRQAPSVEQDKASAKA